MSEEAASEDWPYSPARLQAMTETNLEQERTYLTARAALGHDPDETRRAITNVKAETERRKERAA